MPATGRATSWMTIPASSAANRSPTGCWSRVGKSTKNVHLTVSPPYRDGIHADRPTHRNHHLAAGRGLVAPPERRAEMAQLRREDSDRFFDYDLHIPSRTMFIGGEVEEQMAELMLKGMHLLVYTSKEHPIRIILNSPGGDEYHGLAIFDAIATCPVHVTVTAFGHCMSMGSWILQAADERILSPRCTMMIHYGTWFADDSVRGVRASCREMERMNLLMEEAYLRRMKERDPTYPLRKLRRLLDDDTYIPADEAIEMGLADRILEG
ncbi:MAG: hypothetical protein GF393_04000 [Armatimonadia bacterium]|nr:hypothetical protein [Armatimonadia bacterium]